MYQYKSKSLVILVLFLFVFAHSIQAQLENISLSPNTSVSKAYVGLRSDIKALIDSSNVPIKTMASIRIGFVVRHDLNKSFAFEAQSALQHSNSLSTLSIPAFELIYKMNSKFQIRAGHLVTPTTTTRPMPVSWQSQVETYAQSRIIGSKPGLMLRYAFLPNLFVVSSLHYQNNRWAPHARIDYKKHRLAGYYENNSSYFISLKSTIQMFESIFNFNKVNEELAGSVFYSINPRFTIFTDVNRKMVLNQSDVWVLGFRSYFKADKYPVAGFFGMQYDVIQKYILGQFFIHLADLKKE
jgi:hypothetical protein